MKNKSHVITRANRAECGAVCQNDRLSAGHIWQTRSHVYGEVKYQTETRSDVVIPNKLGNGATCQGLRHWKLLFNLKNNNLFPYFPISFSLKDKKLRRFRIKSGMTFIKQFAFTFAEGATHVDLPPTKVKFAFTLAETLITLGIIGIVAAMTIPNLMTVFAKKRTETQVKEFYSKINQTFKLSSVDNGDIEGWITQKKY